MTNEKIIEMINEGKIEELKQKLTEETLLEPLKSKSRSSLCKKIVRQLKGQKSRQVLQKCDYKEGYQLFTNTYWAMKLVKEEYNPLLKEADPKENYPNLMNLGFNDNYSNKTAIPYEDLKREIVSLQLDGKNIIELKLNGETRTVNAIFLELMIDYLFHKDEDVLIEYQDSYYRPIRLTNKRGSSALIMPIR